MSYATQRESRGGLPSCTYLNLKTMIEKETCRAIKVVARINQTG